MKILITGSTGLAKNLSEAYHDHSVTLVSRSTGHDIAKVDQWGSEFLNFDCVMNCAYREFSQISVLEFFYKAWKNQSTKQIINIGSRSITHKRLDGELGYWPYRLHKQALQQAVDAMLLDCGCDIKIINPGPIDTAMISHQQCVKFDPAVLAQKIKTIAADPTIKRVDLWA
jgi:hypothetical protein